MAFAKCPDPDRRNFRTLAFLFWVVFCFLAVSSGRSFYPEITESYNWTPKDPVSERRTDACLNVRVAFVRACLLPAQTTATPHAHCFRFLFRYSFAVCCSLVLVEQRPRTEDGTCIHWTTVIHCSWCVIVGPRRAFVQFKNLARQDLNVVHSVALC